ncbi:mpv17-like protein 2 isoform X2 [Calliopsis andreniformis]|uniref:mpv17-like protein 2 isoform X2 n=1 Tax=Calliopsis andreniformis TaxID=337506 RepID=UPI003FCC9DF6
MTISRILFGKYLLITNTVSCGLMMAAADMIQQRSEHWKKTKCLLRKHCLMAVSPEEEQHKFNSTMSSTTDIYVHDYVRTRNMMSVGLIQGPFHHWFYTVLDKTIPGLGILECHKIEEIFEELRIKLYDTWKVDCCFWPPTQCVNFFFIPFRYRVLYINFMTMIYDIFLSYIKYDVQYK